MNNPWWEETAGWRRISFFLQKHFIVPHNNTSSLFLTCDSTNQSEGGVDQFEENKVEKYSMKNI